MLIQTYNWKGMTLETALKITSVYSCEWSEPNTFNVTLTINRYTDSSCQYDIEQFTKSFINIPEWTIEWINILNLSVFDSLLLNDEQFQWATQIS